MRKSTHLKGDRVQSTFSMGEAPPTVKLGGATITNMPLILATNNEELLSYKQNGVNSITLSARFYNEYGALVMWMADNRFWAPKDFVLVREENSLEIYNRQNNAFHLKIWNRNEILYIEGKSFVKEMPLIMTPDILQVGERVFQTINVDSCGGAGIMISF